MRVPIDPQQFAAEKDRYQLRFCCEHCAYFVAKDESCAHFWPVAEHRETFLSESGRRDVLFCKEFELA